MPNFVKEHIDGGKKLSHMTEDISKIIHVTDTMTVPRNFIS